MSQWPGVTTDDASRVVALHLSHDGLGSFPQHKIGRHTNLELKSILARIGRLTNLERLDISQGCLSEIPAEIGNLTNLKYLDLSHNSLSEIPAEIGGLISP